MSDKVNAARVAWATVKLSEVGQRPARLDDVATRVDLPAGETLRLLDLTWRDQVAIRDGMIELDVTPAGRAATRSGRGDTGRRDQHPRTRTAASRWQHGPDGA